QVEEAAVAVELEVVVKGAFAHGEIQALARRIPGVEPVARAARLAAQLRQEADAVAILRHRHAGGGAEGGQEVGAADEVATDAALADDAGPTGDERHVGAAPGGGTLAAAVLAAAEAAGDAAVRA